MAILPEAWFVNFIILSVLLILLLACLSATARRLRDVGYSGWFTFLSFIPYCVGLIILLFFTTKPSKKENNKYIEDTQSNLGKFLMQSNRSFIGSLLVLALLFGAIGATDTDNNSGNNNSSFAANKHSSKHKNNSSRHKKKSSSSSKKDKDKHESSSSSENSSSSSVVEDYHPITYDELARNPQSHMSEHIQVSGSVVQVVESSKALLVDLNDDPDQAVIVRMLKSNNNNRILEGDWVNIQGTSVGTIDYKTVMGNTRTVPAITTTNITR